MSRTDGGPSVDSHSLCMQWQKLVNKQAEESGAEGSNHSHGAETAMMSQMIAWVILYPRSDQSDVSPY